MEDRNQINFFAQTVFRDRETVFGIKEVDRNHHMHLVGRRGSGKTDLMLNMLVQDMQAGRGVLVLDSSGEFAQKCLQAVPRERAEQVVYFDSEDNEFPIAFNFLEKISPDSRVIAAEQLEKIFKKTIRDVWSEQTGHFLKNILLSLMNYPSVTLLGINKFLVNEAYRQKVISAVRDEKVRKFWDKDFEKYYPQISEQALLPLREKLAPILEAPLLKNIIGQTQSQLNLEDCLTENRIVIMKLTRKSLGNKGRFLLGGLLLAEIQLLALERVQQVSFSSPARFYLYINELSDFVGDGAQTLFSDYRRAKIGLVSANQSAAQMSPELWWDIFRSVATIGFSRLSEKDVRFFSREGKIDFPENYAQTGEPFQLFLRLMIDGQVSNFFRAKMLTPLDFSKDDVARADDLIALSRKKFSTLRASVEKKVNQWLEGESQLKEKIEAIAKAQLVLDRKPRKKPAQFFDFANKGSQQFLINCWGCGEKAEVPFRPDEENPVFCSECLKEYRRAQMKLKASQKDNKKKQVPATASHFKKSASSPVGRVGRKKKSVPVKPKKEIDYAGLKKMISAAMKTKPGD